MAEDMSRTTEEQRTRRNVNQAMRHPEQTHDAQANQEDRSLSSPALLRDRSITQRGNAPVRSGVMRSMGNTHGNRAVQRFLRTSPASAGPEEDHLATRIESASGTGNRLEAPVKDRLEESLGADMSGVNVHTGSDADALAKSMSAVAFTTGNDIFFSEGAYNPHSTEGLKLLAHEATHTVQQASGPVDGTPSVGGVSISDPSDSFEQEAEQAAERVGGGTEAASTAPAQTAQRAASSAMSVQRFSMPSLGGMLGGLGGMLGGAGIGAPYMPPSFGGGGGGLGGMLGGLGSSLGGMASGLGGMLGEAGIGQPLMPGMGDLGGMGGGDGGGLLGGLGGMLGEAGIGAPFMPGMGDLGGMGGGGGLFGDLGGMLGDAGIGSPYMPGMGDTGGMFGGDNVMFPGGDYGGGLNGMPGGGGGDLMGDLGAGGGGGMYDDTGYGGGYSDGGGGSSDGQYYDDTSSY